MRALVIGADGFAGRWLVRHLLDAGDEVHAGVGPRFAPPYGLDVAVHAMDVRDAAAVRDVVGVAQPEAVYYLAGVSDQGGREDVEVAVGVTVAGSLTTLVACGRLPVPPRLLFVSSGYVYDLGSTMAVEHDRLQPTSVYASAKLAAERALLALAQPSGVEVVVARPFNHVGPGQQGTFLVPTLARQVADALSTSAGACAIRVRDVSSVRDYSDVRDVVAAYRLLAERGKPGGTYNVATGVGTSVRELVRLMAASAGLTCSLTSDDDRATTGSNVLVGDASRLRELGWRPQRNLGDTLGEVVAEHRARASAGHG